MKVNMMSLSGLMNIRWSTSPWPLSSIENSLVEASVRVAPSIQNVVSAGMWRSPSVAKLMVTFSPLTDNTGARRHHWQWCSDKFNVYISLFCSTNDVLTPNPFFWNGNKDTTHECVKSSHPNRSHPIQQVLHRLRSMKSNAKMLPAFSATIGGSESYSTGTDGYKWVLWVLDLQNKSLESTSWSTLSNQCTFAYLAVLPSYKMP